MFISTLILVAESPKTIHPNLQQMSKVENSQCTKKGVKYISQGHRQSLVFIFAAIQGAAMK